MPVHVHSRPPSLLDRWHQLPTRFTADRRVDLDGVPLDVPCPPVPTRPRGSVLVKDYDAVEHPSRWSRFLDVSRWGVLVVEEDGAWLGGAVVAWHTPGCHMLEGRSDLAVLWDLRVAPTARRRGR